MILFKQPGMAIRHTCACVLVMSTLLSYGNADEQPVQQRQSGKAAKKAEDEVKKLVQAEREKLNLAIGIRIEDISRTCSLDAHQVKKLNLAAKGAINKHLETWSKSVAKQRIRMFKNNGALVDFDFVVPNAPAEDPPEPDAEPAKPVEKDAVIRIKPQAADFAIDFAPAQWNEEILVWHNVVTPASHARPDSVIVNQPFWKKALKKTLTAEQYQSYEKRKQQRIEQLQNLLADQIVGLMDRQLLLSVEQQKRLGKLLHSKSQKTLSRLARSFPVGTDPFTLEVQSYTLPEKDMKNVLTKKQFAQWQSDRKQHHPHDHDHDHDHDDVIAVPGARGIFNVEVR